MTFAREAWPFVFPFGLLAAALLWLRHPAWAGVAALGGLGVLLFFRMPSREIPADEGVVVSAACGRVLSVERLEAPEVGEGPYLRIATFLSVFDVHVQRAPVAGRVASITRTPGRKVAAFRGDADRLNERSLMVLEGGAGRVGVSQIVGLVARRIVTWPGVGDRLERGQLYGLIKFGSRVDVYLPEGYRPAVAPGDRVVEGETVIARKEGP